MNTKRTALVLAHRDGKGNKSTVSIIPLAGQTIKCAATFAALALAVCAGCGVCALASGGGCAAAAGTLSAVIGCNAALGVREALK